MSLHLRQFAEADRQALRELFLTSRRATFTWLNTAAFTEADFDRANGITTRHRSCITGGLQRQNQLATALKMPASESRGTAILSVTRLANFVQ